MNATLTAAPAAATHVTVILNPLARRADRADIALRALRATGVEPRVRYVLHDDVAGAVQDAVAAGEDRVLVGGGDGTLAAVLPALVGTSTALGVLPLGTGNTFARNLAIPINPALAARVAMTGRVRCVDVGLVNGRPFLNSVSVGMSAGIASRLTPGLKRRYGWLAYPMVAWRVLARARPFHARITLDGQTHEIVTSQLVVANALDVAVRLRVPHADFEDGDLVLLALPGPSTLAAVLAAMRWAAGDPRLLRAWRFREGEVVTTPHTHLPASADGELVEVTPLTLAARQQALRVLVS